MDPTYSAKKFGTTEDAADESVVDEPKSPAVPAAAAPPMPEVSEALRAVEPTPDMKTVEAVCAAAPEGATIVVRTEWGMSTAMRCLGEKNCRIKLNPNLETDALWRTSKQV